jgi:hypothetical protein
MLRAFQSVQNEQGKTAIIFFVSMAVLAFLLHPKTSPFAEHYYNFKAESQLTQLYDSCKLVWAAGGQHNTSSKDKKGSATECDLATAALSPYDFLHDKNVVIEIKDGSKSGFSATAKHKEGAKTVEINADGKEIS